MASVTLATSEWIGFFKEAGIPAGPAVNYAVTFVDNRIQKSMLMDLNKEIMNELGITAVGDVIAILKHAKVVHRQGPMDICKAITEPPSQNSMQAELRRNANSPATRMIANSLSRDSPPSTPVRRPDTSSSKISVTVSNKGALKNAPAVSPPPEDLSELPLKCRRVTAEMEGKYVVNMPKGTTPRTKKILEEQAARGMVRTSVFDRLGAESKADTTTASKPTGVFSRLGDAHRKEPLAESDEDGSVLQYAGVLKRKAVPVARESQLAGVTIKARATSSEQKPPITTMRRLAAKPPTGILAKSSMAHRLGTVQQPQPVSEKRKKPSVTPLAQRLGKIQAAAQDSKVTSTKAPAEAFRVTIKRTLRTTKVSSTSDNSRAQMDNTHNVSVFKRLGMKSV
ncbi:uncharacterized protein C19orf47 homolog [Pelodytes ibericus]